jgi:hypothetical protein
MPLLVPLECVVAIAATGSEIVDLITVGITVAVFLAHAPCPSNVLCPLPPACSASRRRAAPPLRPDELDAKALKVGRRDIAFNMHHPPQVGQARRGLKCAAPFYSTHRPRNRNLPPVEFIWNWWLAPLGMPALFCFSAGQVSVARAVEEPFAYKEQADAWNSTLYQVSSSMACLLPSV